MVAAGHAEFALSAALRDIDLDGEHEQDLVRAAIMAGVVGALSVIDYDERTEDPTRQ